MTDPNLRSEFEKIYKASIRFTKEQMEKKYPKVCWRGKNNIYTEEGSKSIVKVGENYYDGDWKRVGRLWMFHGNGIYYNAAGIKIGLCYYGEFKENEFHGKGRSIWTPDSETWINNRMPKELCKEPPYCYFGGRPFLYNGSFMHEKYHGWAPCIFKDNAFMAGKEVG